MEKHEIEEKSKELIEIKRQIKQLIIKEQELKTELMPSIKDYGSVNSESGRVYYIKSKGSETFSRKSVLEYLRNSYGDSLANQVDEVCTKRSQPREVMYVQIYNF